jgi:glucose-6-phosphate 1-dehydrogenase
MTAINSDALVFFGATGDLAYKKIFPALQGMIKHGTLNAPVIGVAKADWGIEQLRERARKSLEEYGGGVDKDAFDKLMSLLRYVDGDYREDATFQALRKELGDAKNPTHYLAIPPSMFSTVGQGLGKAGCAEGARVIIEKPFGRDIASAQSLNDELHRVFDEQSIFRIDHKIRKIPVLNILIFRFSKTFLDPILNRNQVS